LTIFNGDVLFELPPIVNLDGHSGQMQGMDKKHDGHAWHKVKMTNIKNDFNLTFWRAQYLGHLQCRNYGCDFFLFNKCKNETTWMASLFMTFKEVVLLLVHHFTKFVKMLSFMLICV
jgi:hypothetical protein